MRKRLKDMNHNISEDDMLIHILNNLPNDYINIVELLERKIGVDSDSLTLIDLRDELTTKYQRILKARKVKEEDLNEDNEDDTALLAGKFKGRCRKCGKFGHKAAQCKSTTSNSNLQNTNNGNNRFNDKCYICGRYGHTKAECWYNKKNL